MDIMMVLNQMLVLLLLLVVGVVCAKTGVIDKEGNRRLTRFAMAVCQVAMILSSVINADLGLSWREILLIFASGWGMYAVLAGLGLIVRALMKKSPDSRGVFAFMTIFGNVGFMGFPVVGAIFGEKAIFYASLYNIPFNVLCYTLGVILLRPAGEAKEKLNWRSLINGPLVASLLAIVILALDLRIPQPIDEAVGMLGDAIVPLSMVIIGASLGEMKLKEAVSDWRCYVFSAFKLLLVPVLIHFLMGQILKDPFLLGVTTVLSGMPVAAISVMLTIENGGDESLASKSVFISTVLSVITIPLICGVLL